MIFTYIGAQANLDGSTCSGVVFPYYSTPVGLPLVSQTPHAEVSVIAPESSDIEFNVLVTNITDMIQQNFNSKHFAAMKDALSHVTVHPLSPKPLFSDAELAVIKQTKDTIELAEMCRNHWSYNNYSLLKLFVKKSRSKDAKDEMMKFSRTVYARKKLKDLESNWLNDGRSCPEGFQSMMVIVDEDYDDITINQLEEVEKFIYENTKVSVQATQVLKVCTN